MGMSAGCFDTYESDLLCQWIDVTDAPDGIYTLVVRVNYNRAPDIFGRSETNFDNNWAQVCVDLSRTQGVLTLQILESCPDYTDCMGVRFGSTTQDCNNVCGGLAHYGDINEDFKTDIADVEEYEAKMQDQSMFAQPCYDLDGDEEISIYDLLLLQDCIKEGPSAEPDPLHTHCDFPTSVIAITDTAFLSLDPDQIVNGSVLIYYKSNADLIGMDFTIVGLAIDSVVSELSDVDFTSYSADDRVSFRVNSLSEVAPKTDIFQPLLRLYFSESIDIQMCLGEVNDIINNAVEKVVVRMNDACVDLQSTSVDVDLYERFLKIYPNPSEDYVVINLDNRVDWSYTVIDQFGRVMIIEKIIRANQHSFDISNFPSGIYFIRVDTYEQTQTVKLIKI